MSPARTRRLPTSLRREIDRLVEGEGHVPSEVIREILNRGLRDRRLDRALREYRERKVSIGRAAEIARLSLWEMLNVFRERRICLNYTAEDLDEDLMALEAYR